MKEIKLKRLKISHFKGLKAFECDFSDRADVVGDNEKGKTTLYDAFLWLLFGKDSTGRKEFEIKHISNGKPKDAEVEGLLEVGGRDIVLKRTLREKWTKRRGSTQAEMTGHETICHVDDVPVIVRGYMDKVDEICPEEVFKMVTSPGYFTSLHWKEQRAALFEIVRAPEPEEVAGNDTDLLWILAQLKGRDMDDYRKIVLGKKKKIKEEIEGIPQRIDEVERSLPEGEDFEALRKEIWATETKISRAEAELESKVKALEKEHDKRQKLQAQLYEARAQLDDIVREAETRNRKAAHEYQDVQRKIHNLSSSADIVKTEIAALQDAIDSIDKHLGELREGWHKENARQFMFDPDLAECPTCQRPLEPGDIEEKEIKMREAFNKEKGHNIKRIQERGHGFKEEKTTLAKRVDEKKGELAKIMGEIGELKKVAEPEVVAPDDMPGFKQAQTLVEQLEKDYSQPVKQPAVDALREKKRELQEKSGELRSRASKEEQIKKGKARIAELEKQQQALAQDQTDLEKEEHLLALLEQAQVAAIESEVNSMFKITRWRLFEKQINGQIIPMCEAMHKGVPYGDLNNAARINCGIDIANTLAAHYKVKAPIFIDNAEAVVKLHEPAGQLIRLVVEKAKPLTVINH